MAGELGQAKAQGETAGSGSAVLSSEAEIERSPAADVLQEARRLQQSGGIITLAQGVRVRLLPVSGALTDDVRARIKYPRVPTVHNESKGRDEENPLDPDYLDAMRETNARRGTAYWDALVTFGIELVDGLPADDTWLRKLQLMVRHGMLDLGGYDLDDPLDKEFLYKRYVIASVPLIKLITETAMVSPELISAAEEGFRGNGTR